MGILECFRAADKVAKLSSVEYWFPEGFYVNVVEERSIDLGQNVLQVLVIACEA
jgi:hypothetical protein